LVFAVGSPLIFSIGCRPAAFRQGEGMVSPAKAHPCRITAFRRRRHGGTSACCYCNHFQVAIQMNPFHLDGVHGIQKAVHVHV
jgi:hypothetical protein